MREAAPLLAARCEHFVGNVEPERALAGACDVLVTDGFTGNVFLKTAEGIFDVVRRHVKDEVARSWRARWGSWLMQPVFEPLRRELDWRHRGGALLLGVGAPVVVGHGRSDAEAVRAAVRLAHYSSKARLTDQVTQAFRGPDGAP
jgi:glycerol-3-phosphate acyltransferase PlsX